MQVKSDSRILLDWYKLNARDLPWRVRPCDRENGLKANPYHVWMSEIMLQQTTVAAVKKYFEHFTQNWPDLSDLASAEEEDVLKAWAGLGYYSRARNLFKCAKTVQLNHNGRFPEEEARLLKLPGIGAYTAAAISAIAFGRHAAVVDGNVERVLSRRFAIETPLPALKKEVKELMGELTPDEHPGDFAQAIMDLGATVCTPRSPNCLICPWMDVCEGRKLGIAETLPRKAPKKEKPLRRGMAFLVVRSDGAVLLRKRPDKGLLAGMSEPLTTPWSVDAPLDDLQLAPFTLDWDLRDELVRHTFTHFHLEMSVYTASVAQDFETPEDHWWSSPSEISGEALPTVMRKAVEIGCRA
ncbi:A/G-specific adenine glycosylase [Rhodobacteraceae bacterium RKSG542]|uniref:A/G-specific adenine glycosylase n=1 Tax=Pseudovibrio flavus TaxID=2529854 RepID=UPI0035291AA0|nr:A/G-specific adenine glycosylase [Pseudovibrio flavus]